MRFGLDKMPPDALLSGYPEAIVELVEELRLIVRRAVPEASEAVRPGWRLIGYDLPVGRRTTFWAWVMPEPGHVHLGFPQGILMADSAGVLEGAGITKRARWLTVSPGDQLDGGLFADCAVEAARIARLSRSERMAVALDREARWDSRCLPPDPR